MGVRAIRIAVLHWNDGIERRHNRATEITGDALEIESGTLGGVPAISGKN